MYVCRWLAKCRLILASRILALREREGVLGRRKCGWVIKATTVKSLHGCLLNMFN
jgi:hypothetical protein